MVKLRTDDLRIIAIPDVPYLGIVLYLSLIGAVLMVVTILVLSIACCEPSYVLLHFLPHEVSETSAPQLVTACHL